jgi:hypothetical protein
MHYASLVQKPIWNTNKNSKYINCKMNHTDTAIWLHYGPGRDKTTCNTTHICCCGNPYQRYPQTCNFGKTHINIWCRNPSQLLHISLSVRFPYNSHSHCPNLKLNRNVWLHNTGKVRRPPILTKWRTAFLNKVSAFINHLPLFNHIQLV